MVPNRWLFEHARYEENFRALYENVAIPLSHLLMARGRSWRVTSTSFMTTTICSVLRCLRRERGPAGAAHASRAVHSPSTDGPASNLAVYALLADEDRLWFNGISGAQLASMPAALRRSLGAVHHGLDVDQFRSDNGPRDGFLTLARFAPEKGHAVAARVCAARGDRLTLAGSVGPLDTPAEVKAALRDTRQRPDGEARELRYFAQDVLPHLVDGRVEYVGAARGEAKRRLLNRAKALLLPIEWEEPFGIVAVEALACGTPVVAYALRGALCEIVEHGVPPDSSFRTRRRSRRHSATWMRSIPRHVAVRHRSDSPPTQWHDITLGGTYDEVLVRSQRGARALTAGHRSAGA